MKRKKRIRFFWEEPFEKAERILEGFEEPFEFRFKFPRPRITVSKEIATIPVNVSETDKEIIVRAELPGFKREEINLNVTENTIDIAAKKKREEVEKGETFFRKEVRAESARRAFTLPVRVDPTKTEAELRNGILVVRMPKFGVEKKKSRKIKIK